MGSDGVVELGLGGGSSGSGEGSDDNRSDPSGSSGSGESECSESSDTGLLSDADSRRSRCVALPVDIDMRVRHVLGSLILVKAKFSLI